MGSRHYPAKHSRLLGFISYSRIIVFPITSLVASGTFYARDNIQSTKHPRRLVGTYSAPRSAHFDLTMVAEYTPLVDTSTDIRKAYNALSPSERISLESSLKRRLDRRLFPCLLTFYLLNYIDRNALPAARLLGLESDLNLSARE